MVYSDSQERVGKKVVWFERESSRGRVSPRDGSGNHPRLLLFCPTLEERACHAYLNQVRSDHEEYEDMLAEVIVITTGDLEERPAALPFPVVPWAPDLFEQFGLVDEQGQPHVAVVATDRYGTVESCAVGDSFADLPEEHTVAVRLSSAEDVCPECGVPEAQWVEIDQCEGTG